MYIKTLYITLYNQLMQFFIINWAIILKGHIENDRPKKYRHDPAMLDNARQCSTMFDNVRRVSTAELRCLDNTRHLIPSLFPNFITVISQYAFNIIK